MLQLTRARFFGSSRIRKVLQYQLHHHPLAGTLVSHLGDEQTGNFMILSVAVTSAQTYLHHTIALDDFQRKVRQDIFQLYLHVLSLPTTEVRVRIPVVPGQARFLLLDICSWCPLGEVLRTKQFYHYTTAGTEAIRALRTSKIGLTMSRHEVSISGTIVCHSSSSGMR
jgi:hypothetical protein